MQDLRVVVWNLWVRGHLMAPDLTRKFIEEVHQKRAEEGLERVVFICDERDTSIVTGALCQARSAGHSLFKAAYWRSLLFVAACTFD